MDLAVEKKYNPGQPRHPKGSPLGGQWAAEGGHDALSSGKQGIGVSDAMAVPGDTPEERHLNAWHSREQYEPDPEAAAFASDYRKRVGLPDPDFGGDLNDIPAHLGRARTVTALAALDYAERERTGTIPAECVAAYRDLEVQTAQQLKYIQDAGVQVEFLSRQEIIDRGLDPEGKNPYPTAKAQRDDIANNSRLMIASLADYPESYHPLLDSSKGGSYDQFRAVHDYFGHAAVGTGFDRHGEFQAWLHHTSMFYGPARLAASSELHIENSFLASNPLPNQSSPHFATLLPGDMADPFHADGTYKGTDWLTRGDVDG